MIVKVYLFIWAFILFVFGTLFLTGLFNNMVGVLFGLIAFGMVFMGIIAVLPISVTEEMHNQIHKGESAPEIQKSKSSGYLPSSVQAH